MEEMIKSVHKNTKWWPRPSDQPQQLLMRSCSPGLKDHQAPISNVEKMGIGPRLALILTPNPLDCVQNAIERGIGGLITPMHLVAWGHQMQTTF